MGWTSTKRTGSEEYPTPRHLIRGLIDSLVAGEHLGAWAHFELETQVGIRRWFPNGEAFIEVALDDDGFRLLNGEQFKTIPSNWRIERHSSILVPHADQDLIVDQIDTFFKPLIDASPHYTLKGWLDGL